MSDTVPEPLDDELFLVDEEDVDPKHFADYDTQVAQIMQISSVSKPYPRRLPRRQVQTFQLVAAEPRVPRIESFVPGNSDWREQINGRDLEYYSLEQGGGLIHGGVRCRHCDRRRTLAFFKVNECPTNDQATLANY